MSAPRLLGITPDDGRDLRPWLDALARAGLPGVLLREKSASAAEVSGLVKHCIPRFEHVYVHHRCADSEALAPRVRGLHLPDDRTPPSGPHGRSTHSPADARRAIEAGALYALLSPIWPPGSKRDDRRATLGPSALDTLADLPVLALGGVTVERYRALRDRGVYGAAGVGIAFHGTPEAAAARIRSALAP